MGETDAMLKSVIMLLASAAVYFTYGDTLHFDHAMKQALARNGAIAGAAKRIESARSEARQAGAWENPELEIAAENFGINEIEASIAVPIHLGAKRKSRKARADIQVQQVHLVKHPLLIHLHLVK